MASRPTPYSIAVSTLIALHCQENSPLYENSNPNELQAQLFLQETVQCHAPTLSLYDRPVASLLREMKKTLGLEITRNFHCWLLVAAESIDSLEDLMVACKSALAGMDRRSSCGLYLWGVCLGYNKLSFEVVAALWKEFRKQVQSFHLDDFNENDEGNSLVSSGGDIPQEWPLSEHELSEALQRQVQKGETPSSETLRSILDSNPELPLAHFMDFSSSLQAGEREAAVDALHQYLDYSFDSGSILQYAAIVAAVLHHSFGDAGMARAAAEEAVRVAQQSQDEKSVAFALGWLALVVAKPQVGANAAAGSSQQDLIRRCVQRATESNLRSLAAGANMILSQLLVGSNHPSHVWACLSEALTDEVAADGSRGLDRPTHMTNFHSGEQALRIIARQRLVAAGIWDVLGHQPLAEIALKTVLQCHKMNDLTSQDLSQDIAVAVQNLARCSLLGFSAICDAEYPGSCKSSIHQQLNAQIHSEESNDSVYVHALKKILGLRELFHLPVESVFPHEIGLLLHEQAVRRGELGRADLLSLALSSHICPRIPHYEEVVLDVESQNALRLSRQGRWEEAKSLLQKLITQCKQEHRPTRQARLLLQLSMLILESGPGFTRALPSLLQCLTLADSYNMNGLHAAALTILGQVHLRMKKPKRAVAVIRTALPTLLQHEHVWLQGEAYLTLAKCQLQEAKQAGSDRHARYFRLASSDLQESEEMFRRCEDYFRLREVYYLIGRVSHFLKEFDLRDEAAKNFVAVSRHLDQASRPQEGDTGLNLIGVNMQGLAKWASDSIQVAV